MERLSDSIRKFLRTHGSPKTGADISRLRTLGLSLEPSLNQLVQLSRKLAPGRYLVSKDHTYGFMILLMIWDIGVKTPIHSHGTWGIEVILGGQLRIRNFERESNALRLVSEEKLSVGDASHVLPPDLDLHEVRQCGTERAISVHIYGGGLEGAETFDLDLGFIPYKVPRTLNLSDIVPLKTHLVEFAH